MNGRAALQHSLGRARHGGFIRELSYPSAKSISRKIQPLRRQWRASALPVSANLFLSSPATQAISRPWSKGKGSVLGDNGALQDGVGIGR